MLVFVDRPLWVDTGQSSLSCLYGRLRPETDAERVTNWSKKHSGPIDLAESVLCESIGLSGTQRVEQAGCDLRVWQVIALSYRENKIVGYRFLRMNDVTGVFADLLEEI